MTRRKRKTGKLLSSGEKLEWPKPSPIPFSSMALLLLNALLVYAIYRFAFSPWWAVPLLALNIFFFWAEGSIYSRRLLHYKAWNDEMRSILNYGRKQSYKDSLALVRRRSSKKRKAKSKAWTDQTA